MNNEWRKSNFSSFQVEEAGLYCDSLVNAGVNTIELTLSELVQGTWGSHPEDPRSQLHLAFDRHHDQHWFGKRIVCSVWMDLASCGDLAYKIGICIWLQCAVLVQYPHWVFKSIWINTKWDSTKIVFFYRPSNTGDIWLPTGLLNTTRTSRNRWNSS